jgi:DNA mismatch endonuclease (patch repair protein)
MGHRYRLHDKSLPGKPDLVFRGKRKVLFVHGCFWHQHAGCLMGEPPASNLGYWIPKLGRTVERDREHMKALRKTGWKALVIWECQLEQPKKVEARIRRFLTTGSA